MSLQANHHTKIIILFVFLIASILGIFYVSTRIYKENTSPDLFEASNEFPEITVQNQQVEIWTNFRDLDGDDKIELPPMVMTDNGWKNIFLSGGQTTRCKMDGNMNLLETNGTSFQDKECYLVFSAEAYIESTVLIKEGDRNIVNARNFQCRDQNQLSDDWRRNYYGTFGVHPVGNKVLFTVHGENANYICKTPSCNNYHFQNTIDNIPTSECANTCFTGEGMCYDAFNELISWSWMDYNKETGFNNQDHQQIQQEGPIAWPALGFVKGNRSEKASLGLRHPTSIIKDGYLYVYYIDQSKPTAEEADDGYTGWQCLKVARAKLDGNNLPEEFHLYYNGQFSEPALPEGVTKNSMRGNYDKLGPRSTCLIGQGADSVSRAAFQFNVAKIKGTDYYLGVEESAEYRENGTEQWELSLRLSKDLVNWGPRKVIRTAPDWVESDVNYPIFWDKTGSSNYEIDAEEFYILGTTGYASPTNLYGQGGYNVIELKLSIDKTELIESTPSPEENITPPLTASPSPTPPVESANTADLNNDRTINVADFVIFIDFYQTQNLRIDFDENQEVTINDFVVFRNEYIESI